MAEFTHTPWDGSASRWPDAAAFAEACLINENSGPRADWTKSLCKLPYKEPSGGAVNVNAVHAAAAALAGGRGGVQASAAAKKSAARTLKRLYAEMKEPVPSAIARMAL